MHSLLLLTVSITLLINLIHAHVLLYDTEASDIAQYFDCIYWTTNATRKYCRRENIKKIFDSTVNNNCTNGGETWFFNDLAEQNISPTDVLSWSSSVERVDDYAHFYYNNQQEFNHEFLCNCTRPGTFGLRCEYELLHETITFEGAIMAQFNQKEQDPDGMQRYGDILCYQPVFECDYGLLCLDWRDICDGQQQCINGTDEENCDLLEFNECEDDEYRCDNGMCITEEYWLDGK